MTSACVWIKNKQMCILKYQKSPREAQFWQVKHAFNTTQSDLERKSLLFFWLAKTSKSMKMHNDFPLNWIVKCLKIATQCNMASKWHLKNINKTHRILITCSKRPQHVIIQIVAFLTYSAKVVKYAPEGSRGAPGGLTGPPEDPPESLRYPWQASKTMPMNTTSCKT